MLAAVRPSAVVKHLCLCTGRLIRFAAIHPCMAACASFFILPTLLPLHYSLLMELYDCFQIFDNPTNGTPRVKASQCFTKYIYRSEEAAAADDGQAIVATQVVSDYLTPYDGEELYFKAMNKPVVQYTYTIFFERAKAAVAN